MKVKILRRKTKFKLKAKVKIFKRKTKMKVKIMRRNIKVKFGRNEETPLSSTVSQKLPASSAFRQKLINDVRYQNIKIPARGGNNIQLINH